MGANERQVAGDHYKASLQHWDVMLDYYGSAFLIGCAVKYITRWRKKGTGLQDLQKAEHYVEKIVEWVEASPIVIRGGTDGLVPEAMLELYFQANDVPPKEQGSSPSSGATGASPASCTPRR